MKKIDTKGAMIIGSIVLLGTLTFFLYRNNKKRYAQAIIDLNASQQPYAWLMSLDEGYLKEWSKAAKAGKSAFSYNGKNYNAQGGRATA